MQPYLHNTHRWVILLAMVALMSVILFPGISTAQGTSGTFAQGTPVEVTGVVTQLMANNVIIVAGLTVDVSHIALDPHMVFGSTVRVTGLALNNVIVAQTLIIVNPIVLTATPTPIPGATWTPMPTWTPIPGATWTPMPIWTPTPLGGVNVIVVVEGPVINIVNNILTIYNFTVQVAPENPILLVIGIGDDVRVEGTLAGDGVIVATTVSNVSSTTVVSAGTATVSLDGPVESINGNQLVVNSVPVRLEPNDPRLTTLHTGDFVRVQGNFQGSGTTIVLVVVNITIVNNVVVNGNPVCWFQDDGMGMGHWHCDGMGMGDPGMGMGDPGMGMGMGG